MKGWLRRKARTPLGRARGEAKLYREELHRLRNWVEGYRQAIYDVHGRKDR